ncbi:small integral membrane protein 13 isoform X3 [Saimiri boliviensis]|uniref:small integral membrane protein 13 isoform X3 n=1 Tax=Saimiri boliviensis TaxID=27679 RepID=UPI003D76F6E5
MWHSVGLTLLVFVATLLIVLLLMVCGQRIPSGAIRRAACDHEVATVFKSWQTEFCSCCPGWSTMTRSRLTAASQEWA